MRCLLLCFGIAFVSRNVLLDTVPGLLLLGHIFLIHGQIFWRLLTAYTMLLLHKSLLILITPQWEDCWICLYKPSSRIRKLSLFLIKRLVRYVCDVNGIGLIIYDNARHPRTFITIGYCLLMDRIRTHRRLSLDRRQIILVHKLWPILERLCVLALCVRKEVSLVLQSLWVEVSFLPPRDNFLNRSISFTVLKLSIWLHYDNCTRGRRLLFSVRKITYAPSRGSRLTYLSRDLIRFT